MPVLSIKTVMEVLGGFLPEPIIEQLAFDEMVYVGLTEVAASGTETIDFGGVTTASFVFVRGNRALTYNVNSTGTVTINAGGHLILFNTSVTTLVIVNSDGVNVLDLEVFLGGT